MHCRQPNPADHSNTGTPKSHLLVCPMDERMPTKPLCPEGPRMELPVSLPREIIAKLAEAPAAGPPELPALLRSRSKGLRTTPKAAGIAASASGVELKWKIGMSCQHCCSPGREVCALRQRLPSKGRAQEQAHSSSPQGSSCSGGQCHSKNRGHGLTHHTDSWRMKRARRDMMLVGQHCSGIRCDLSPPVQGMLRVSAASISAGRSTT